MRNAKVLATLFVLVLAVLAVPAVAAEAPAVTPPAASVLPAPMPAPIFMSSLCTCEVSDPCTVPPGFILIGGFCADGQGCRCTGHYNAYGCLSSYDFECTGNSDS
ncbi:MAG TPA: hypothetical protein VF173_00590 [Thermoanaerobaculia bacterium]|nr:hypothetical protein [Thermoanaerobaculia bacterium]